ncbi:NAD dependent oxidoreductase [Pseudohyphozyma bogoriensis]|nr:NAD dependent oxidoreductase [Pseudohyphozyma bogoriensis]
MGSSAAPIRLALLGAGNFARDAHLPAIAAAPSLHLVAVYSRSLASANDLAAAAKQYPGAAHELDIYSSDDDGLAALLARSDIEAVSMALPILLQPDIIEQVWAAGKHVINEKPVGKDVEAGRKLIERYETVYKPKGIQWIIAEQWPYMEVLTIAKDIISSGKIGKVLSFTLDYSYYVGLDDKNSKTTWRSKCEYQGGYLLDGGVHMVAALRYVLPSPITQVTALTTQVAEHLVPSDLLHAIAVTDDGVHGSFRIAWGIPTGSKRTLSIYGDKGNIDVDFGDHADELFRVSTKLVGREVEVVTEAAKAAGGERAVVDEFAAFGKALQGRIGSAAAEDVEKRSGPRAALADVGVIQASLNSNGSPVKVYV